MLHTAFLFEGKNIGVASYCLCIWVGHFDRRTKGHTLLNFYPHAKTKHHSTPIFHPPNSSAKNYIYFRKNY